MKISVVTMMVLSCMVGMSVCEAQAKKPTIQSPYRNLAPKPTRTVRPTVPKPRPPVQRTRPPQHKPPQSHRHNGGYNPGSGPIHLPNQHHRGQHGHHDNQRTYNGGYNPGSGPVHLPPRRPTPRPTFRRQTTSRVYVDQNIIIVDPQPRGGNWGSSGTSGSATRLSLSRGDVILAINGQSISDRDDCIQAVNSSPSTMNLTVRDSRDGTIWQMQTQLRSRGSRFGVNLRDNPGGGAYVTGVFSGYPSTRCYVVGK